MKKVSKVFGFLLFLPALIMAQETAIAHKVESPFRLIRGVMLKSDLTMTVETINQMDHRVLAVNKISNIQGPTDNNQNIGSTISRTIFARPHGLPNQNSIFQSPIVLDGFLVSTNPQNIGSLQVPTYNLAWRY